MTIKSLYIVYITNRFLWTMSDNKAYLILKVIDPYVHVDQDMPQLI